MWWECLPSMAIICVCSWAPQVIAAYTTNALHGNMYRRALGRRFDRDMFLRDTRIDGAPWKVRGLENIPDKENPMFWKEKLWSEETQVSQRNKLSS